MTYLLNLITRLFLVLLISMLCSQLLAQSNQIRFQNLINESGFRNAVITSIFQDSQGFIWIGSYSGLAKYDGRKFTYFNYEPSDPTSLSDSKISTIIEDPDGSLWIGTQYGLNKMDRNTETFERIIFEEQGANLITYLFLDTNGDLWIGSSTGIQKYDVRQNALVSTELIKIFGKEALGWAGPILRDNNEIVWIGARAGLIRWNDTTGEAKIFKHNPADSNSISHNAIYTLTIDKNKRLWIGTGDGMDVYDADNETFTRYSLDNLGFEVELPRVRKIIMGEDKLVWFATGSDIMILDSETGKIRKIFVDSPEEELSSKQNISAFFQDEHRNVWVGTAGRGLFKFSANTLKFKNFLGNPIEEANNITALMEPFEIEAGKLLIWEDQRLKELDFSTGEIRPFPLLPQENRADWDTGVTCVLRDKKQNIWFGTANGGLFMYDPVSTRFTHFEPDRQNKNSISGYFIRDLLEDRAGNIWVATFIGGICRYEPAQEKWTRYLQADEHPSKRYYGARKLYLDKTGTIWAGTRGGLHKFDSARSTFRHFEHIQGNPLTISESTVFDMYEDLDGNFWIGTYGGGLNLFDRESETFTYFTIKDGLPDNNILSILPDSRGNLWLSTFNGLVYFDQGKQSFTTYDQADGLANTVFGAFGAYKSPYSGHIVLEGDTGTDVFHPDSIFKDQTVPKIAFTSFKLSNKEVPISKSASIEESERKGIYSIPRHISALKEIVLPHHEKVISFEFAALHYAAPKKNQYAYRLEGFDDDWQEIGNNNVVTFTNLDPGTYTLRVKASNADGAWNEEGIAIKVKITPPWWETWWAYAIYAMFVLLIITAIYRYQRRRWQLQTALRLEQQEAGKLKELDALKTNLYTNITHEFRTPLTVILGLSKMIQEKLPKLSSEKVSTHLQTIDRNGRGLLRLVNQMLDLNKIEAGKFELNYIQGDIISYLKVLVDTMSYYAQSKELEIHSFYELEAYQMDFDREKLEQVINNLLSNAIKFTPAKGHIYFFTNIDEEEKQFHIKVKDTGIGISKEKIPHIFDRFYQIEHSSTRKGEGTGIGLALTKQLLHLMQGRIWVQSKPKEGSTFEIVLPIRRNSPIATDDSASRLEFQSIWQNSSPNLTLASDQDTANLTSDTTPLILIVEDNRDVRAYVRTILDEQYIIKEAQDGQEGIEKALKYIPDIVITDVMMPRKDGFELCSLLKSDERTSHIPIIMLTAKADLDSRLVGLAKGADAYLAKPFSSEELRLRIDNLIQWTVKLRQRYQGVVPNSLVNVPNAILELEDGFLRKIRELIEARLDDSNFGAEELSRKVFLSRTQVHRKIKALTGKSTGQYIHAVRLNKALTLLQETDMTITQIAFEVGYKEVSYFSRRFAEEYGKTASSFRKAM